MKKVIQHLQKTILTIILLLFAATSFAQDAEVYVAVGHPGLVSSSYITNDLNFVATAGQDGLKIWDYETVTPIKTFPTSLLEGVVTPKVHNEYDVAMTDDHRFILYKYEAGYTSTMSGVKKIAIIDVEKGAVVSQSIELERPLTPEFSDMTEEVVYRPTWIPMDRFISPDSKYITSVHSGKVSIFEIATGKKLKTAGVQGHFDNLAYSADGKHVFITTRIDNEMANMYKLNIETGYIQSVYHDKVKGVQALTFSRDGTKAITVTKRHRVEVWNPENGAMIAKNRIRDSFLGRSSEATQAWISEDGSLSAIEFGKESEKEYLIIDTNTAEKVALLDYRSKGDHDITFSRDNNYMALEFHDVIEGHSVDIYNIKTGRISSEKLTKGNIRLSKKSGEILRDLDGVIQRESLITDEVIAKSELIGLYKYGGSSHSTPNGKQLIKGAKIWDLQTGELIKSLPELTSANKIMNPDGKSMLVKDSDSNNWREFNLANETFTKVFHVPDKKMHGFMFSSDGEYLLAISNKEDNVPYIQIWDSKTGEPVRKIIIDEPMIFGFDISSDSERLLMSTVTHKDNSYYSKLSLYDFSSGSKIKDIANNEGVYFQPKISPDGSLITSNGLVWDSKTGELSHKLGFTFAANSYNNTEITSDGEIILGSSSSMKPVLVNFNTGEKLFQMEGQYSPPPTLSGDGSKVIADGIHYENIYYDTETGEKLATTYLFKNDEWVTITPDGYYDASGNGAKYLKVRIGLEVFSIDNFFETYYRPDIVREALSGQTEQPIAKSDIRENAELPPSVQFTSPSDGLKADKKTVTLAAEITDQGGGIDEVRLFHNGKLIEGGTRGLKLSSSSKKITRQFEVTLLPGTNEFELTALSTGQRIESNPAKLKITYQGTVATSDLYVLAVGLNEYKNNSMNLNYGRPDAEAFVSSIKTRSDGIFKSVNVTQLHDGQATRSGVKAAFEDITSKAQPQDAFLFFYAGHGVMSEPEGSQQGDFYMALHDATQLYGNNDGLAAHGISAAEMTDLTRRISARKQMIVLDACQSGGAVETFAMRGAAEQKAIIQLARSAGLVVMASTGTQQYATEFSALGHGVFTYALLNGLQGKADGGSQDGKITVKELEAFINDRVPVLTEKHRGQSQYPNSYARGQDFPIGVIK